VRLIPGERQLTVAIEPVPPGRIPAFREVRRRFLANECERAGGQLACRQDADPPAVRIELPLVNGGP
jgi:hypothetical protein